MSQYSKSFCVLPFLSLSMTPSGNLRVCCESQNGNNLIKNSENKVFKIYDDLRSAWSSQFYQDLREQFLKGEEPSICRFCFEKEKAGLTSDRLNYNQKWQSISNVTKTPPLSQVKYLDFKIGNTCNLKCRMCSPWNTHLYIKEWDLLVRENVSPAIPKFHLKEKQRFKEVIRKLKEMDFYKLTKNLEALEEIYFTGGEPLLIKEYSQLLEALIHQGRSSGITLKYSTNLTQVPDKILNNWTQFKHVQLNVSIDAFQKLNHYIRYPSNWTEITNNLVKIESFKQSHSVSLQIHCTVQMYNILRLREFLLWIKKRNYSLHLNFLNEPRFLNICVLPKNLKQKVEQELLLEFKKDFNVQSVITYMNSEDQSQYLGEFFHFTKCLDKSRKQNIFSFLPELEKYKNRF